MMRNQYTFNGRTCVLSLCFILLFVCCLPHFVFGQASTATLSGTVEDQNGAVVPAASVTVINVATGFQRTAVTNDSGSFTVPLLPPASYSIRVTRDGFSPVEVRDVVLNVGDQKSLQIQLKTGDVNAQVTVNPDVNIIREDPAVATVVDRQFVENMPLNGRSFQSLISLTPGVVVAKTTGNLPGQFSVNGQRTNANYFTIDGVSANFSGVRRGQAIGGSQPALSVTGGTNNLVSIDALQEFRIQTSTYAPEFGRQPGAQVQLVTRSGTNAFHCSFFDYWRNDALDANDWFANANRLRKPKERQNDFGGVFSGPIVKNRIFFFFSYEGLRLRQPLVAVTEVPSLASRAAADSLIQPLLRAFPLPNGAVTANGFAQLSASYSNPTQLDATAIRLDYVVNSRLTLFGRYNHSPSSLDERAVTAASLNTVGRQNFKTQTLTFGVSQAIGATVSNEFRANYSEDDRLSVNRWEDFGGAIALPPPLFASLLSPQDSLFTLALNGGVNSIIRSGFSGRSLQRQFNVIDNLSWVAGAHQFKAGVDYRRLSPLQFPLKSTQALTFQGVNGALSKVLSSLSAGTLEDAGLSFDNLSLYAQDTWKRGRRLTLTYGLRWELNPPLSVVKGPQPIIVQGVDNISTATVAPDGAPLWKTSYYNFAPRIGAVFQIADKKDLETVLRGGFGIFYDLGSGAVGELMSNYPFSRFRFSSGVAYPPTLAQLTPPALDRNPPFANQLLAFEPDLKLPYSVQWNLAVEQSLGNRQAVSISYVAAVGRRLLERKSPVNTNPNFFNLFVMKGDTTSDYHALQLQFQRRLTRGLQALASYTWSHSIDDVSEDSTDRNNARGSSDFDLRHSFSGAMTYDIPTPDVEGVENAIMRNWSIDTLMIIRSALPVSLTAGTLTTDGFLFITQRPSLIAGVPVILYDHNLPGGKHYNRAAFTIPATGQQGSLGRNALRGFGAWQMDLALRRQIRLTEKVSLQLRGEAFNVFNHPNFGDPQNSLTSGLFGLSTQMLGRSLGSGGSNGGFSPLYQVGGPRSIQVALRLSF